MNEAPWYLEARARYLRSLEAKAEALESLLDACLSRPDSPEALDALRAAFHRIHGSAGSYGLDELGELCGRCEDRLVHLQRTGRVERADLEPLGDALRKFRVMSAEVCD